MLIHGALVMDADDEFYDVAVLLLSTLAQVCDYQHYPHPSALNPRKGYDFIIVSQISTLQGILNFFTQTESQVPPVIHLVKPQAFEGLKYEGELAKLSIYPIMQAELNDTAGTLQFDSFYQTIQNLRHQQGKP